MNVKSIDEFSLIKLVGEGAFSKVVFAVHKETETEVAFKIMHKESLAGCFDEKRVETEKRVLDAVGAFKSPLLNKLLFFYQDASRIFFGLEFCCGGDLLTYFMRNSRVPERQIRQYASEIVIGLCVLHQNRIAYRDLKLDNILLDKTGHIKLCDFGLARTEMDADSTAFTFCGTPDTMAPELFRQTGYRRDVDYWALGVVVYEMFHRRPPFAAPTMRKLAKCVCEHEVKIEAEMSPEARDFVTRLLEKDPMMRLGQGGPDELKRHPWFADVVWDDVIHATNHVYHVPTGAAKIDKSQRINLPFTVAMSGSSGVIDDDIEG
ncbi:AKT1 [Enterospora canceri]|uniref:non-specific serine/threonine protein kinase n=1 Tax=Enterospora canceri TaxID=1081671 RepID=A0A1Y1S777_9MICR|nr:AKT1 [Enterospora canceri]